MFVYFNEETRHILKQAEKEKATVEDDEKDKKGKRKKIVKIKKLISKRY